MSVQIVEDKYASWLWHVYIDGRQVATITRMTYSAGKRKKFIVESYPAIGSLMTLCAYKPTLHCAKRAVIAHLVATKLGA
jgi:hypothetical protein